MRRLDDDALIVKPAPVGHNGGPPLDLAFTAWAWRRAHARAWDNPGREVVMLRLRRAARLGLSYRDYTSVLLDRGTRLCGVIVMRGDAAAAPKLATLSDCTVMLCGVRVEAALQRFAAHTVLVPEGDDPSALLGAFRRILSLSGLPPGAVFLVGSRESERRAGESAGLGLFVEAKRYFEGALATRG